MTIAPWTSAGRALVLALTLTAVVLPAAAQATQDDGHTPRTPAERLLAREEHRRMALAPAREVLARKRAERRLVAEILASPAMKPKPKPKPKAAAEPKAAKPKAAKPRPAATKPGSPPPAPPSRYDEDKALELPTDIEVGQARADTGGSLGRTLFGLMIVVGLIYGLTLLLRRMRSGALGGGAGRSQGLKAVASIPLGPNRSIHLVRAGAEYLLVGAAEHGVVPLRTYTEDEARAAGLLDLDGGAAKAAVTNIVTARRERTTRQSGPKLDLASVLEDLRAKTVRR